MNQTIAARYDNGVFTPLEKVSLPDHSIIRLVISNVSSDKPRKPLKGLLSGMGIHLLEEDIRSARAEMWGKFPRDID